MIGPFAFCRSPLAFAPLALVVATACADDTSAATGGAGGTGGSVPEGGAPHSTGGGGTAMEGGAAGHGGSSSQGGQAPGGGGAGTGGAEPLLPPDCPPGTTEIAASLACDPGPLPSDALLAAVDGSVRGDVVVAGPEIDEATCMPVRSCVSDAAPTLLFSDEPEYVDEDGILYADIVEPGNYRLYVYHVNDGLSRRRFTAVALNQGNVDATISVTRSARATPSANPLAVGRAVAAAYFAAPSQTPVVAAPGERVVIDPDLDALVADSGELLHAIVELHVDHAVKISIVSVGEGDDAAAVTAGLSVLPNTGAHTRGTFPAADRLILAKHDGGIRGLRLGGDLPFDPHIEGTSFVDAGAAVTDQGNFGVVYDVRIDTPAERLAVGVNPRAGAWEGAMLGSAGIDGAGGVVALPSAATSVADNDDLAMLGRYTSGISIGAKLLTGGGSSLPVVVAAIPQPDP